MKRKKKERSPGGNPDNLRFYSKKIALNILAAIASLAVVYACYANFRTYAWVHNTLLLNNFKVARANAPLTPDQVRGAKLGFNFQYLMTVKQGTPPNAVIWMPESDAYFMGEKPYFDKQITSKIYRLRVLYPRKIVDAGDVHNKYADQITHVAIINGKGYEVLNYEPEEKHDFAVFPMKRPK